MATITGTSGVDTLQGTADADTITPLAGNDIVNALAGNDTITIAGTADTVAGGAGDDTLIVQGGAVSAVTFQGDADVDDTGAVFTSAAAGTDTIKFTNAADSVNFATAITNNVNGTYTVVHEGDGTNANTITATGVEKVQFLNGTIDLTNPLKQYFNVATSETHTTGGAVVTVNDDADIWSFTPSTPGVAATFDMTEGTAPTWKITKVGSTAISADGTTDLGDFTVTVGGTQTTVAATYDGDNAASVTGVNNTSGSFEVTLTSAAGDTLVKTIKLTDNFSNAAANTGIKGTSGNDLINLGAGVDGADGGAGNDTIIGGLDAQDEVDTLTGGSGNDVLFGGGGADVLTGGTGNDTIDGGTDVTGSDRVVFTKSIESGALTKTTATSITEGTDTFANVEEIQARNLGSTINSIIINAGALDAGGAQEFIDVADIGAATLGVASKAFFGGEDSAEINGGGSATINIGDDFFELKSGAVSAVADVSSWTINGYRLDTGSLVTLADSDLNKKISTGSAGDITFTSRKLSDAAQITYTASESAVQSTDQKETVVLQVTNGTDTRNIIVDLTLLGKNGTITGTDNDDNLSGGDGDDAISGGKGNDTLDGGNDKDTLKGEDGDDQLLGGDGDDTLDGGDGNDTGNGGDGADSITGGKGDDAFFAGSDDNGNDTLKGGDGNDTLGGGQGNDSIDGGAGENLIFGGDDHDTIIIASGDDSLEGNGVAWAGDGDDTITGGSKDDMIGGGKDDDKIDAGDGNDTVFGGATGDDSISGGKGDDKIFASTDRDTVTGGAGNDTIFGGDGKDSVDGDAGNDELWGGADNDTIKGGDGKDTIDGGAGNDSLTGGANADTFTFETGDGADTISDFKTADGDVLDLSGFNLTNQDILSYALEQTVSGSTGIILQFGNNDSIFMADVTLSQIRDANIVWSDAGS